MANSFTEIPVTGVNTYTFSFPYISQDHIKVFVGGALQTVNTHYTFTDTYTIQFTAGNVPSDTSQFIRIQRDTDTNNRLVNFSNTGLDAADLNLDSNQLFYMSQEAVDTSAEGMVKNETLNFDGQGSRIVNVADPVDAQDVATAAYVAEQITAGTGAVTVSASAPANPKKGDLWIDTADNIMYVYTGAEWVNGGVQETERHDFLGSDAFLVSGDQAYFAYDLHNGSVSSIVQVYLNGVLLKPTTASVDFTTGDYNILGASELSIKPAPSASDEITVVKSAAISAAILDELNTLKDSAVLVTTVGHGGRSIKETITASEGQTILNLTNSYVQDINNVSVYVNGVRQSAYVESTTTSITLTNPLTVGDEVVVIINEYSVNQGGHINPRPNLLINGGFDIWQRGTSFTTPNAWYSADRWISTHILSSGSITTSKNTFAVGQTVTGDSTNYLKIAGTSAFSNNNSSVILAQFIEGVETLEGKTTTLSFWAKTSNVSGRQLGVGLYQNFGNGANASTDVFVMGQQTDITNTWTQYTFTFDVDSINGKTIDGVSYLGLNIYAVAKGTSASAKGWTEIPDLGNDALEITQVKLEEGNTFTGWPHVDPATELFKCQKYFVGLTDVVASAGHDGAVYGGFNHCSVQFPRPMRNTPQVNVSSFTAEGHVTSTTGLTIQSNPNQLYIGAVNGTASAYRANNYRALFTYSADAEL